MADNILTMKVDHRGFTIGIGREREKVRHWTVSEAGQVVARGTVEKQKNQAAFRQAIMAAQAAIDHRLDE